MNRIRPQLTAGEIIDFISKYPRDTLVSAGPSLLNLDEPVETQEFIMEDEAIPVVSVSYSNPYKIVVGWEDKS